MKQTHGDIALLLAPPKSLDVRKHEENLAKELEVMEVVDEEGEERLERVRRRALEWKTNHFCRGIILELLETAALESEWRQQTCMEVLMDVMEGAVMESRLKMCKQLMLETVIGSSWESLEVRRILRETKEGGVDRMERIESELRMKREERECVSAMLEEERCLARRLEKKERLQRAWRLGMEAKRYVRMVRMLEELSVCDMEMEVESI